MGLSRKEWLQKFLMLADAGETMLGYRRELRLFPAQVKGHLKKLGAYRAELALILKEEEKEKVKAERLEKAREIKAKRRAAREKKKKENGDDELELQE